MIAHIRSFLLEGIDARPCEVEVDLDESAINKETVVGLPDAAVKESLERVRAAMVNAGYAFPLGRILVNLAPADVRKEGPVYDLPIAVGLLIASGAIDAYAASRGQGESQRSDLSHDDGAGLSLPPDPRGLLVAGELALDGRLRPVKGVIAMATLAKHLGLRGVIVPADNAREAAVVQTIDVYPAATLADVVGLLNGTLELEPIAPVDVSAKLGQASAPVDFADVRGQESVKRALTIAAAGQHNLLMLGPAGTGKTMMARALPGILPPMTPDEALHVTRVYSAAGKLAQTGAHHTPDHAASSKATATRAGSDPTTQAIPSSTASPAHDGSATATAAHDTPDPIADLGAATADHAAHDDDAAIAGLVTVRPVRAPHHTASSAAVIGGGIVPKPGEISLAHRGVLFLDELPEFPRSVLDTLRQPLESGDITISRAHGSVTFPARFMLVAAMNPTAKGDMPTDAAGRREMERYLARVSRPLIDRIDIHVEAPAVPWKQLTADAPAGESSTSMRTKVLRARRRQRQRQGQLLNSELTGKQLNHYCPLTHDAKALLGQAITELGLSARAYDKVRRIALTIADLDAPDAAADGEPHADDPSDADTMTPVGLGAIAEAIQYRLLDRRV